MLTVLYQDAHLIAIAKPSDASLFADRSEPDRETLWARLTEQLAQDDLRPLSVHRLDKGTSGVLLAALDRPTQRDLNRAFNHRTIRKFYIARVAGEMNLTGTGVIDLPLRKGRKSRYRVAGPRDSIHRDGDVWTLTCDPEPGLRCHTAVRKLGSIDGDTLLLLAPKTGRTHQLRVHLAWIGYPIKGDHLYGRPSDDAQRWPRMALHCHRLVFQLGESAYSICAPVPDGITGVKPTGD